MTQGTAVITETIILERTTVLQNCYPLTTRSDQVTFCLKWKNIIWGIATFRGCIYANFKFITNPAKDIKIQCSSITKDEDDTTVIKTGSYPTDTSSKGKDKTPINSPGDIGSNKIGYPTHRPSYTGTKDNYAPGSYPSVNTGQGYPGKDAIGIGPGIYPPNINGYPTPPFDYPTIGPANTADKNIKKPANYPSREINSPIHSHPGKQPTDTGGDSTGKPGPYHSRINGYPTPPFNYPGISPSDVTAVGVGRPGKFQPGTHGYPTPPFEYPSKRPSNNADKNINEPGYSPTQSFDDTGKGPTDITSGDNGRPGIYPPTSNDNSIFENSGIHPAEKSPGNTVKPETYPSRINGYPTPSINRPGVGPTDVTAIGIVKPGTYHPGTHGYPTPPFEYPSKGPANNADRNINKLEHYPTQSFDGTGNAPTDIMSGDKGRPGKDPSRLHEYPIPPVDCSGKAIAYPSCHNINIPGPYPSRESSYPAPGYPGEIPNDSGDRGTGKPGTIPSRIHGYPTTPYGYPGTNTAGLETHRPIAPQFITGYPKQNDIGPAGGDKHYLGRDKPQLPNTGGSSSDHGGKYGFLPQEEDYEDYPLQTGYPTQVNSNTGAGRTSTYPHNSPNYGGFVPNKPGNVDNGFGEVPLDHMMNPTGQPPGYLLDNSMHPTSTALLYPSEAPYMSIHPSNAPSFDILPTDGSGLPIGPPLSVGAPVYPGSNSGYPSIHADISKGISTGDLSNGQGPIHGYPGGYRSIHADISKGIPTGDLSNGQGPIHGYPGGYPNIHADISKGIPTGDLSNGQGPIHGYPGGYPNIHAGISKGISIGDQSNGQDTIHGYPGNLGSGMIDSGNYENIGSSATNSNKQTSGSQNSPSSSLKESSSSSSSSSSMKESSSSSSSSFLHSKLLESIMNKGSFVIFGTGNLDVKLTNITGTNSVASNEMRIMTQKNNQINTQTQQTYQNEHGYQEHQNYLDHQPYQDNQHYY